MLRAGGTGQGRARVPVGKDVREGRRDRCRVRCEARRARLSERLALSHGRDAQGLPILCHGTPRHDDALFPEQICDATVR